MDGADDVSTLGAVGLRTLGLVCALAFAALGCASPPAPAAPARPAHPPHFQIVRALTGAERRALVARFLARNPSSPPWQVNDDALVYSVTVVDPFRGFLRRARRIRARSAGAIDGPAATTAARAFVTRNADLLGIPQAVVAGLAETTDRAPSRSGWLVRFTATFPTRGYEGFGELDNEVDVGVTVDDDGEPVALANVSRIHPPLTFGVTPELAEDDPRVIAALVGRRLFALSGAEGDEENIAAERDVRVLERIPLGELQPKDVSRVSLMVHVSPGPERAWLAYRLAYLVQVRKAAPGAPLGYHFFRYVVDADSGAVLEDARAPLSPPTPSIP